MKEIKLIWGERSGHSSLDMLHKVPSEDDLAYRDRHIHVKLRGDVQAGNVCLEIISMHGISMHG
jgi:hypothetical protein